MTLIKHTSVYSSLSPAKFIIISHPTETAADDSQLLIY